MILASTEAPSIIGVPIVCFDVSDTAKTSLKEILSPFLPSSYSTLRIWPALTEYCFPPVLKTANIDYLKKPGIYNEPSK